MAIAMASNVGGMTSPISSPQNIFAISLMSEHNKGPGWLAWFCVALPVSCACNFLIWGLLIAIYKPGEKLADVRPVPASKDPVNWKQVRTV
jgi:di/tricarboxylate transporter